MTNTHQEPARAATDDKRQHSAEPLRQQPFDSAAVMSVSNYSESDRTVVVAIDPACPECAETIRTIARLDDCRIELVFIADQSDKKAYNAALRMISSGIRDPWETTLRIIARWYETHTLPAELDVHPLAQHDLESQIEYCRNNRIASTPTVLVDGRRLPENGPIEELHKLLQRM